MAGNEQLFDSIVDPKANAQVKKLADDLLDLDGAVTDTIQAINQLNQLTANSSTFSGLSKNTANLAIAQEKLNNLQQQGLVLQAKRDAIIKSIADKQAATIARIQAAETKAADTKAKQDAKAILDSQKKAAQVAKENGEYAKLVKSYNDATLAARNAGVQFGANSLQFQAAAAKVKEIRSQLDSVDQPLGNFQRNVGNYANSIGGFFNKAFSKIRLLANILPNFGIGTFFLLLGTGIATLVEKLGLFDDRVPTFIKNLQNLNDVMKSADQDAASQSTNLKILYEAATDLNNNYKDRIRAAQELKKEFPGEFKNASDLSIINGELSGVYQQLTVDILANAKAKAAASKISELAAKQLDIDFEKEKIVNAKRQEIANVKPTKQLGGGAGDVISPFSSPEQQKKSVEAQQQTLKDLLRGELRNKDEQRKVLQDQIDFLTNFAGGNNKIAKALSGDNTGDEKAGKSQKPLYEEQLKALKLRETAILENEKSSYEDRLKAVNDYFNDAYDLTKKYSDKGVLTQVETNNKLTEFDVDTNKDRIKIADDARKELAKLIKDGLKDQEDAERASIELIQKAGDDKILVQQQNAAEAEQELAKQYADGLISQKEYQSQLTAIEDQADIDRLDQEIVTAQAIIDVRKGLLSFGIGSAKELQSAEDKLANLKLQRVKAGTKAVLDGVKDETQARQQLHDKEKQLGEASLSLIQTVVDAGYQRQLQALQDLSNQVDTNATKEKDALNSTLLSTKDKADKAAIIDAKSQQQKQQIAIKEKQLKKEQAEFDRAIAIARIIEETAIGVVTALSIPFAGIGLAATIAALGAVQLATVLATPLPAFKDGGVTGGGHILWGEAGMEKATLPGGQVQYSNGPTIQDFPKGTVITPHLELMKSLKPDKVNYVGGQEVPWREILSQLKRNEPKRTPNKIIIKNDISHDTVRKSYFK